MSQQSQLTRELQMIQSSDVAAKQQLALLREEKVSRIDRIDRFICIGSIFFSDANSIDFDWHFPPFAHRTRATDTGSTGIAVGSADEERRRYAFQLCPPVNLNISLFILDLTRSMEKLRRER